MLRYLFADMNSFFASVEQQEKPHLRGKPIAIVPMLTRTTCCIAASYEAKATGVKTGTAVHEALKLCPRIRLVEARPEMYVRYHHRIIAAMESCLHVDRVCSIDEMYGRLLGEERRPENAAALAHQVKHALRGSVGEFVRCSIGIAPNAWLAKVASDMQKPDGLTMILPEQLPEALCRLKLTDLPGIARNMEARLNRCGIHQVHQLYHLSLHDMCHAWNSRAIGSIWWHQLRGYDLPYQTTHRRTVGHSHVLPPDWRTPERAHAVLVRMIHKAAARLRRLGYWAGSLHVSVQFMDGPSWERHIALGLCRDTLTMLEGFASCWTTLPRVAAQPYLVGAVLTKLVPERSATQPMFQDQVKRNTLADVMDRIDRKHGRHTVYFAGMFGAQESAPTRISFTQIPTAEEF